MKYGHRRTQSNLSCNQLNPQYEKLKVKIQPRSSVSNILNQINHKKMSKTVNVQALDIPRTPSHHNIGFFFGKKRFQTQKRFKTCTEQIFLIPVPEEKRPKQTSIRCIKKGDSLKSNQSLSKISRSICSLKKKSLLSSAIQLKISSIQFIKYSYKSQQNFNTNCKTNKLQKKKLKTKAELKYYQKDYYLNL